jgi:iron(III) transport system ATP-binding protein
MAELTIDHIGKSFGNVRALDDVSIVAEEGKFLTLLGPSGCGKSTTLWSVAGLHSPSTGTITIGDDVVFDVDRGIDVPPEERACGVVFQSYALWPHMSVADNVGYPLKLRKLAKSQRHRRVDEVLDLVELGEMADRYPHQLSGGQQQRALIAMALLSNPKLLLLDEPTTGMTEDGKRRTADLIQRIAKNHTVLVVKHDMHLVRQIARKVTVMHQGQVLAEGSLEEVVDNEAVRAVYLGKGVIR